LTLERRAAPGRRTQQKQHRVRSDRRMAAAPTTEMMKKMPPV
jgi:hypothetical protein